MKILVVDDSVVFRTAISQALNEVPGYDVVKTCSNGQQAIDYLKTNKEIDLVTLDLEMPVLDGLQTISEIRKFNKTVSIIVFSSHTTSGAEKTMTALSNGANDFVGKIAGKGTIDESLKMIRNELVPKIDAITSKRLKVEVGNDKTSIKDVKQVVDKMQFKPRLICMGSSTGGPEALMKIFRQIKEPLTIPILMVQHMPPLFTEKLAEMLSKNSVVMFKEAKDGDIPQAGYAYIAPGDYHMTFDGERLRLNQNEKVCFVRPAVDVLFKSVSENFSNQVLSIVLTGMGEDGANGAKDLARKNAYQFIQDKESSVVWGMPGAVSRTGVKVDIMTLDQISELLNLVSRRA